MILSGTLQNLNIAFPGTSCQPLVMSCRIFVVIFVCFGTVSPYVLLAGLYKPHWPGIQRALLTCLSSCLLSGEKRAEFLDSPSDFQWLL